MVGGRWGLIVMVLLLYDLHGILTPPISLHQQQEPTVSMMNLYFKTNKPCLWSPAMLLMPRGFSLEFGTVVRARQ